MWKLDESVEPFGYVSEGGRLLVLDERNAEDLGLPVFTKEQLESRVRIGIIQHLLLAKLKINNMTREGYCDITAMKAVNIVDSVISEVYADD